VTKSKTLQINTGRGERGPRQNVHERIDAAINEFYSKNPLINVVAQSTALTAEGNVLVSVSFEEPKSEKK